MDLKVSRDLPGVFASVTLWILGEPLGRDDDPVAVYSLMTALEGAVTNPGDPFAVEVLELGAAEAWVRLRAAGDRYRMPPIDFFDDYEMYCLSDPRSVRCLWKAGFQDHGALHDASLPRREVVRAIEELRDRYGALVRERSTDQTRAG